MPRDELSCVRSVTTLFDVFATAKNGVDRRNPELLLEMMDLWFQFALIWGIGGALDMEGRRRCAICPYARLASSVVRVVCGPCMAFTS
jgi:Dynein heavy chain AAA lid domain